ncbi:MAG: hypothetical protein WD232_08880 [Acidimicrobiales bacterium]
MAERLDTDPEALRHLAGRCRWAADDLARTLANLVDGLAALGDVAGDDAAGRAFAADHDAARDRIVRALENLVACARGMAGGLQASADNLGGAERASTTVRAS